MTQRIRGGLANLLDSGPADRALSWLESGDAGHAGRVAVMTYHRVDDPNARPYLWPGLISAYPTRFIEQVELIAARYVPIGMSDLLAARRTSRPVPRRAVHVTFDDAYADFAEHAWPALRRCGVPVTLFVPTAYPDRPERRFWWDRLHAALATTRESSIQLGVGTLPVGTAQDRQKAFAILQHSILTLPHHRAMELVEGVLGQLGEPPTPPGVLGWADLRRLASEGVTLAAHSRLHPRLDRLPQHELDSEILGSFEELRAQVPSAPPIFAYPGGHFDHAVIAAVRRSNIEIAFTTERRAAQIGRTDPFRLPRINVGRRTGVGVLRAQLGSWMRLLGR